jgi:hypothetical protein
VAKSIEAMKDLKQISVDDAVAVGFHYQAGKSITIDFDGCYGTESNKHIDGRCSLIVKGWASATAIQMDANGNRNYRYGSLDRIGWQLATTLGRNYRQSVSAFKI